MHHLARKNSKCLITLIHHYPPLKLDDILTNTIYDATHNLTGHESLPRPATRVPSPLPHHDITGLSADHPFATDAADEAPDDDECA